MFTRQRYRGQHNISITTVTSKTAVQPCGTILLINNRVMCAQFSSLLLLSVYNLCRIVRTFELTRRLSVEMVILNDWTV